MRWIIKRRVKQFIHIFGICDWSSWSCYFPYNVADADKIFKEKYQRYNARYCGICNKEMPHSRHFFNIGVKEKNAREFKK